MWGTGNHTWDTLPATSQTWSQNNALKNQTKMARIQTRHSETGHKNPRRWLNQPHHMCPHVHTASKGFDPLTAPLLSPLYPLPSKKYTFVCRCLGWQLKGPLRKPHSLPLPGPSPGSTPIPPAWSYVSWEADRNGSSGWVLTTQRRQTKASSAGFSWAKPELLQSESAHYRFLSLSNI